MQNNQNIMLIKRQKNITYGKSISFVEIAKNSRVSIT